MDVFLAETVGTTLLILLGNGVVANVSLNKTYGNSSGWIVIATGWGLGVALAVYAVGRISGAHINPAVTIGLAAIGELPWADAPVYIAAQMLGAFLGAILVWLTYQPHWAATEEPGNKLGCFATGPAIAAPAWNLVAEFIGTATLVFGVLAIGGNAGHMSEEALDLSRAFTQGLNPLLVGILVWSIGLSLGGVTGYAINPARDLAPRIAHAVLPIAGKGDSNWSYAWIPVVGPLAGGIVGAVLYRALNL